MNQFFNAQKQNKNDSSPSRWSGFSPPLICFHQKPRGGKRKWMGHLCSCDVIWCDWSQWDGVFEGSPHPANTSNSSARAGSSSPPAGKGGGTELKKVPGGTCQKLETLVALLHIIAYLYLFWWQLPKVLYYKAPQVWFLCVILDKSLTFYSFVNSHSDYWLRTFCVPDTVLGAGDLMVSKSRPKRSPRWVMKRWVWIIYNHRWHNAWLSLLL